MHELPAYDRVLVLTEGQLGVHTAKTAASLLRYRPDEIVAVIDSASAGNDLRASIPWAPNVPILASVEQTASLCPQALIIGIAPVGGALSPELRRHVQAALTAKLDVISGLHEFLADDPELSSLADRQGARLFDLRRPVGDRVVASARALQTRCRRILTVGTDGNVGKMVAALELAAAARTRGLDAQFLATGQTGIMIAGRGISVDACVADFAPGAIEQLVLEAGESDLCVIEGQGSIAHPGFSAVTLALIHGACPDKMILVHRVGRTHYKVPPHTRLPPLADLVAAYDRIATLLHPSSVAAVALNSHGCTEEHYRAEVRRIEQELHLPVADPIRDGCDQLLDAVLSD